MANRWLILSALMLLLAACAKPPRQELDAAEYLVARAYAFQAAVYADEEYRAAVATLDEGHRLIAAGEFPAAKSSLDFARQHALRAYAITDAAKAREAAAEEARRVAEEEVRRKAAEEEARRKAAEEEARKAAEPRTFTSYRVGSGETLASIAALPGVYGDPLLWPLLYQGNRDQIKDPAQIDVGQVLNIPRGLLASDLELARQKARDAGLFNIPAHTQKPHPPR